jgi:glycopeptide antibiotics resistance protein
MKFLAPPTTPSTAPPARPRFRRAADFTALRLGRAVLGYLALTTLVITLAPFRFQLTPAHGLTTIWTWSDLVMNVLMFVPFGFVHQLTRPRGAPADWWRVLWLGAALSGAIETAQLFAPDRYSSLLDVATNTAGALVGAALFARVSRYVESDDTVQSLALELPLMGLVYLLVPLAWLLGLGSEGDERRVLLLLLSLVAGAILGTVHGAYVAPAAGRRPQRWLIAFPAAWVLVSVVPGARGEWDIVAAALGVTLASAIWRDTAMQRAPDISPRRFELPTLRLVLPVFAMYLALASLWPLTGATLEWRWTLALTPSTVALSQPMVYRALEHIAAFTLVGYIGAEYHGRDSRRMRQVLPRVLSFTVTASALLEGARGFHEAYGASVLLFALTQVAAVFGAYVYVLQRAHVRALVKRRQLLAELAARPTPARRRIA